MERDPNEGGTDVGRDIVRDMSDEPPAAIRDAPPDILSPIDESAPVSGHVPAPAPSGSPADAPEHDWSLAQGLVRPTFRPVGTTGLPLETVDRDTLAQHSMQSHSQPLLDEGPAGIPVVYAMATAADWSSGPTGGSTSASRSATCSPHRHCHPTMPASPRCSANS